MADTSDKTKSDGDAWEALLRRLGSDDPFDREEAIQALAARPTADLLALAQHSIPAVRSGFIQAIAGRDDAALWPALVELSADRDYNVRVALANALGRSEGWAMPDEAVVRLARDSSEEIALPGIKVLEGRPEQLHVLVKLGRDDDASWNIQKESNRIVAAAADLDAAVRLTLGTIASTGIEVIARECARHLEARLVEGQDLGAEALPEADVLSRCGRAVRGWTDAELPKLRALLDLHAPVAPDLRALAEFGRDLTDEARRGVLPRAFHQAEVVDALERALDGEGARSAVLVGPTGVGKTAAVQELAHRLLARTGTTWTVLRVLPSELLVGTKYLGEWQTKVKELIELCAAPQRVILFIPGVTELAEVGLSSTNDQMSAASMLVPEIESGRIAVIGEATPDRWTVGGGPSDLARALQRVDVRPLDRKLSREALELVAVDSGAEVSDAALDVTMEVADVYLTDTELPGRAIGLLRRMIASSDGGTFGRADVLRTLEEATGVPPDFLDDSIPLRLDLVRQFLESKVMGQPRALDQVIDLVTLVKAGLDDPSKPSGVLLFVGPTGVGKTELSRALAELLFGDAARLLRFDMSEYASYESYERLIGTARKPGTLTDAVRRQPFSVLLLDEIEKAHTNVFDLCLQIFDAGRLTDGAGRTVSLAKCIVIMTSNLGAKVATEAGVGFGSELPPPPGAEEIERALHEFFRPEFLGRVDHIVRFDALSTETADRIARREVKSVLARGGLARRGVTVDLDPAVYAHVLREGYSPALGARPLKRTVESLVLMPVARVLATEPTRPGACIQLRLEGKQVQARLLAPDVDEPEAAEESSTPQLEEELARLERLEEAALPARDRYDAAVASTAAPGFWDGSGEAAATLDEIHRLEGLLDGLARLREELELTAGNKNTGRAQRYLERHAVEGRRLERLLAAEHLGDAYVRLTGVGSWQSELPGPERLARMYLAWARREGLTATVLDDRAASPESEDTVTLRIDGAGAHALLSGESGLHKLRHDRPDEPSTNAMVRVEVLAVPSTASSFPADELEVETRPLAGAPGRVAASLRTDVHLLHRPTMVSLRACSPLDVDAARDEFSGLLQALLTAEPSNAAVDVVRRYRFGRSPLVRDGRTGRSTGRIDRVFGGEIGLVGNL